MAEIKVRTNGQTLTVNASVSHWTTAALAVTASGDDDIPSTTTTTITSDYSMHFANTATTATITVKQLDGTTLLAQTFEVNPGVGLRVLNPVPDAYQLAGDTTRSAYKGAPSGAKFETVARTSTLASVAAVPSGTMFLTGIELPAGAVISSVSWPSGSTAAVNPTNQWFALYDPSLALLGQTANDTTTAWAQNTLKTLAFATAVTTTVGGLHYIGICVTADTVPAYIGLTGSAIVNGLSPKVSGVSNASLTTTAPATATLVTANAAVPYAYLS